MAKEAKKEETAEEKKQIHIEIVRQMLTLATSGFGLVAALAWNGVIQSFVENYVKKYFGGTGILSLLIYAVIVTVFAVIITLQLSKLLKRLEEK